ncbi:hypothetical protein CYMTET_9808 [Cymbomonas tetramitiformis]|uniref:Uncharacterized protein n=1 Tax=Cymbomonas tetramitiformis TaxID=36881 RepID=A0AAE0GS02_9CHLO|nr:hypothetical protein CYMTET_9808 [Cymbomonas tetramitiformis]
MRRNNFSVRKRTHKKSQSYASLVPAFQKSLQDEESVIFADNLDAQIQPEYLTNQKEKGRALGWSLLKGATHWAQPIDQGAGREVKRDVDYEQNEWLEVPENLEKWESGTELNASDRRILMTWWVGNAYKRTCGRVNLNRYFEKSGCLLTVNGHGDENINPEGLASFTFDRPVIPAVLAAAPVQENVAATTHAELQESAEQEELLEEEELSDEDECSDEEEKWFIPPGYIAEEHASAELDRSMAGTWCLLKSARVE